MGALRRSTFATREVDDDDVRVDFSIFDRKKKIRYYTLVVKTDRFFFLTKPSSYFRIHILLRQRKFFKKQLPLCAFAKNAFAVATSTNAMAAAKRSAKSTKTKKPSPLTSTNAKISAFLSDYVATSNGNAFASGLKLLVKKTSSKKKNNNKADARDENDDQNFFLDGKRVLGLSDAIAKVRFPRLRGRDGVSPRGLRRSVFSSFFSNGVVFRKKRRNENFGLSKPLTKFFLDTDRRWKISTTKASRTTAVDRTRTSFCSTLKK